MWTQKESNFLLPTQHAGDNTIILYTQKLNTKKIEVSFLCLSINVVTQFLTIVFFVRKVGFEPTLVPYFSNCRCTHGIEPHLRVPPAFYHLPLPYVRLYGVTLPGLIRDRDMFYY